MSNKRRFSHFSLKILLGSVTVIALWLAWATRNASSQAAAVTKIVSAGGVVKYDAPLKGATKNISRMIGPDYFLTVVIVRAEGAQFDDSICEPVGMLTDIGSLSLFNAQVTDTGLEYLVACDKLKRIDLMHTLVTDDCIPTLYGMESLKHVNLEGTRVTKRGAEELQALMPDLEVQHHFLE
jgi:hypothetical protein